MDEAARKVIIKVVPRSEMMAESIGAFHEGKRAAEDGLPFPGTRFVYASHELLWKALPPKRLSLLQVMAGQPPMSIREAARRARRDVKAVHHDVQVLLEKGLLLKTDDGRIEFPYDEIHLDVVLKPLDASAA
jgi:predicted transcriptional regulator